MHSLGSHSRSRCGKLHDCRDGVNHVSLYVDYSWVEGVLGAHSGSLPSYVLSSRRDGWWSMTPPSHDLTHDPARDEPPDIRFLARADGYELAFVVPPRAPRSGPTVESLVRLRFLCEEVEVVLTLSADIRRLWDFLRCEQARHSSHD
jgi:hypothetical protein